MKWLAFTAGEITVVLAEGETHTLRQRIMLALITPIMWLTPYSLTDMRKATESIKQQPDSPGYQLTRGYYADRNNGRDKHQPVGMNSCAFYFHRNL